MKTTKKNCKNKHEANIKNYIMIKRKQNESMKEIYTKIY